jgi:hypothetical protein
MVQGISEQTTSDRETTFSFCSLELSWVSRQCESRWQLRAIRAQFRSRFGGDRKQLLAFVGAC